MSKATPGPWKALKSDLHGNDPNRWSVFVTVGGRDFYVASIENGAPSDSLETEEANAHLIAAVPALREELVGVRGGLAMLKAAILDDRVSDGLSLIEAMDAKARAALALADGTEEGT